MLISLTIMYLLFYVRAQELEPKTCKIDNHHFYFNVYNKDIHHFYSNIININRWCY